MAGTSKSKEAKGSDIPKNLRLDPASFGPSDRQRLLCICKIWLSSR